MKRYSELLRVPGIVRVTASQLFARLPHGMLSLAILLHVEAASGSYAVAGLVVACVSLGEAVVVPITSRLVGSFGIRRMLLLTAAVNSIGLVLLAIVEDAMTLAALGLLVGVSVPPIMPAIRALYPLLVRRDLVSALFALDTTSQELIWIAGPVAATVLATSVSTAMPLFLSAAITLVGTIWFITTPRLTAVRLERSTGTFGRVLLRRSVVLAIAASFALVASFMALEIGVVAQFEAEGPLAGLALAVASAGSLLGGVLFGHRRFRLGGLVVALCGVALGTGLAGLAPNFALLSAALFVSGVGFAPALAALYAMVSQVVDQRAAAEAFGWLNTAALVGGAAGTALAGLMSDAFGPGGAYAAATLLAVVAAASPMFARLAGPVEGLAVASTRTDDARVDDARVDDARVDDARVDDA